jgi:hypothetical protein
MPNTQANGSKKSTLGFKVDRPKSTDDWQEAQDAGIDSEGLEDRLDALAGDEPPRVISKKLIEAERAAQEEEQG